VVTVPKTSTLPPPRPAPLPAPLQTKFQEKKRYETTVILVDDCAAVPTKTKKLKKSTDDFTDARNWLIRELGAFRGDQYFAGIFDHKEERSVFKEKGRGKLDLLRFWPDSNGWTALRREAIFGRTTEFIKESWKHQPANAFDSTLENFHLIEFLTDHLFRCHWLGWEL
jgi:hypothetical protein